MEGGGGFKEEWEGGGHWWWKGEEGFYVFFGNKKQFLEFILEKVRIVCVCVYNLFGGSFLGGGDDFEN